MTTLPVISSLSQAPNNSNRAMMAITRLLVLLAILTGAAALDAFGQQPHKPTSRVRERGFDDIPDNRVAAGNTSRFPFSAIVRLRVTFPDGSRASGSGAVIGPNKILTAEHVAYDEDLGGHFSRIEVVLPDGRTATTATSFTHGSHNACHEGADCDFAVLTTHDDIGYQTGWFGFKEFDHNAIQSVYIAGYPSDLGGGQLYYVRAAASHMHGSRSHNVLSYREWTAGGMSGGPIFTSDYYIVGVHTSGDSAANYGVALCNQLFAKVREASNR